MIDTRYQNLLQSIQGGNPIITYIDKNGKLFNFEDSSKILWSETSTEVQFLESILSDKSIKVINKLSMESDNGKVFLVLNENEKKEDSIEIC